MDFFKFYFEHAINFSIASIPMILVYFQIKFFKLESKVTIVSLLLTLLLSIFFWVQLKDWMMVIYQGIAYACAFIWAWAEGKLQQQKKKEEIVGE